MSNAKPLEDASQDIAADLAALREDIANLTASVSALLHAEASAKADTVLGVVERARQKISETAAEAKDRAATAAPDLEAAIERNPLTAVLVALAAGFLFGMLSRSRT